MLHYQHLHMNSFKLQSQFKPTGDQPQAIKALNSGLEAGEMFQTLLGVTGSGKTFTIANVIEQQQRPTLIISHNKTLTAQLATELKEFFPNNAVHYFVSYYDYYQPEAYIARSDTYIEKETQINEEIDRLRHASTQSILTRRDTIIVASVSCIYGLGNPEEYRKQSITISTDSKIQRQEIINQLVSIQYQRNDVDLHRGTFRLRGETLDIFPTDSVDHVIRVTFFDKDVERIDLLDPLTGKRISDQALKEIIVFPARHYVAPNENLEEILTSINAEMQQRVAYFESHNKAVEAQRLRQRTTYDLEMIQTAGFCSGIENYSRYFDGRAPGQPPYTLIDFFPEDYLLVIDESHMTIPQIGGMFAGDRSRKEQLIDYGFRLPSALDNRPLNFAEFEDKFKQAIFVSATPGPYELDHTQKSRITEQIIRPTGLLDPEVDIRPIENQVDDLLEEINKRIAKKQRVLVTTLTKRMSEDLSDYLQDAGIKAYYLHSEVDTLERLEILRDLRLGVYDVVVGINLLREGLDLPEVSLVAILDADKEGFLRSETSFVQTMGRAARHAEGHVIMYADTITGSMKRAIAETERRRKIQESYNKKHGITPRTIEKKIHDRLVTKEEVAPQVPSPQKLSREQREDYLASLGGQMELAARNLEFEKAAELRDTIKKLKQKK